MPPTEFIQGLCSFIQNSPTPFHAVKTSEEILAANGFKQLHEEDCWTPLQPGSYYVTRNKSSLIAFHLTHSPHPHQVLRMAGAHTDSPCLKIKPNPTSKTHSYVQFGIEVYGGALLNPWFDRDLSLAGKVSWKTERGGLATDIIDFKRPIATIPSLAIHLDREANTKRAINKQTDITPIFLLDHNNDQELDFYQFIHKQLQHEYPQAKKGSVLDFDLFLYDTQPPAQIGYNQEFICGSRLDNLLSCYVLIDAATSTAGLEDCMIVLNDNEEVGSVSTTGAQGTFLSSVLGRLYPDQAHLSQVMSQSLFLSVDNAHAVHPNFPTKHEANHLPKLNRGPVLKKNANQRYASDSVSSGLFKLICEQAHIPFQEFVMRNDMACGSTIGPLTASTIGVPTVDIGVPSLGMHSIRETVGHLDGWFLLEAMNTFFQAEPDLIRCVTK
ncbi:MAG: M18 family aminopeptidase [Desulfobulbus propionicus]|nr:MAG: M18 family aminopeptidase [Desulfobulbus propionicus]